MRRRVRVGLIALVLALSACSGSEHFITRTFATFKVAAKANLQRGDLGPGILVVDPVPQMVFVSMGCPDACPGEGIWVLDASLTVLRRVRLPLGCGRTQSAPPLAIDEPSDSAVIGSCDRPKAWIVSRSRVRAMTLPFVPEVFSADPAGTLFMAGGRSLAAIDVASGRVAWLSASKAAELIYSDGRLFAGDGAHRVNQIDPRTGDRLRTYEFRGVADTIKATRRFLFARTAGRTSLQRIRLSDGHQLANVTMQSLSADFVIDEKRNLLWIAGKGDYEGTVLPLDLETFAPRAMVKLGNSDILWMAFDRSTGQLFAENPELQRVDMVKAKSRSRAG